MKARFIHYLFLSTCPIADLSHKAHLTVREAGKCGLCVSPGGKGKSFGEQLARIIINEKEVRKQKKVKINKPQIYCLIEWGGDEIDGIGRDTAFEQSREKLM